jgi:AraC family transcriptional regulator of adaptative response / DNA-3-methyladenine glycosylase II
MTLGHRASGDGDPVETVDLGYRPPLATGRLLAFLSDRAVPGLESFDGETFRRSVHGPGGGTAVIALTPRPAEDLIELEISPAGAVDGAFVVEGVRRLLDLDADPRAIDEVLAADPALRASVRRDPGLRVPGTTDGLEIAVRAVMGQQISVRGARTLLGRLVSRFGIALDRPVAGVTHRFPTPERLATAPALGLGMPVARSRTVHLLAERVAEGAIDLGGSGDPRETLRALDDIPGIGPWTCAYVAMRALRDPDAFPLDDLGVRRGFERLGLPATRAEIRERAERWRPWRAYAVLHLWLAEG